MEWNKKYITNKFKMNNGMQSLISSKLIFLRDFGGSAFFSSLEKAA